MTAEMLLQRENNKLRRELGSENGRACYAWTLAENCTLPRAERDIDGKVIYDHRANAESGLIEVHPRIGKQSMCPLLDPKAWVLCRFIAPPTESQWASMVGSIVPYPAQGYYAPTDINLDVPVEPWDSLRGYTMTEHVIGAAKESRKKSFREHYNDGEKAVEREEAENDRIMTDTMLDLVLPFANSPHVPGKRGGSVSAPFTKQDGGSAIHSA